MTEHRTYVQLFELLRQRSLSQMAVSQLALGLDDAATADTVQDFLRRADRSWLQPMARRG